MTGGINRYTFILLFATLLWVYACNSNTIYTDSKPIPSQEWSLDNIPAFSADITDTVASNNVFFTIRTGTSYPYSNIYLFVTTTSPSGKSITDTLQYKLVDDKGNRYGKGFGDIRELNLYYKNNVYFPVKGIYDIGLRIEKISK